MLATLPLPVELAVAGYVLRRADAQDLPAMVALLADDPVAIARGHGAAQVTDEHRAALAEIVADASNELVVAVDADGDIAAMLQLTRVPGLARLAATRLLVEGVRVGAAHRSAGLGTAMLAWVTGEAAAATGAALVQLTSDEQRTDAHRFYERLGFVGSHRGFKLEVR